MKPVTFLGKRKLLYRGGGYALASWLCGMIFIDERSKGQSHVLVTELEKLKLRKVKLWMHPEGTRSDTLKKFRTGAFFAAIKSQVPIVPLVISSYKNILDAEKTYFEQGEVIITALPEIPTKGLTMDDINELVATTRMMMIEVFNEISEETRKSSMN